LHPPHPIRTRRRAGNVEAVFAREQIGDHDDGNPGFTLEKRFHDGRIKIVFEIIPVDLRIEPGKVRNLFQLESRLLRCRCLALESVLPQSAKRLVIMRGISRDLKACIFTARRHAAVIKFPLRNLEAGDA
jgi:hypothetical protein